MQVIGHVSVEKEPTARRVVEAHFPGLVALDLVEEVTSERVKEWSTTFSQASLVLLGAGPPCQGVSGLNADRRGALKESRSSLFSHVPRVRDLLRKLFCWCPVYTFMESVASMDANDREAMSQAIGMNPLSCKLALHLVSTTEVVLDRLGGECSACSGAAKLGGRDPRRGQIGGRSGSVANGPTRLAQGRALPIFPYLYDFTASGPAWTEAHRHPELHP